MTNNSAIEDIVYQPLDVGKIVVREVDERRKHPGAGVRSYIKPLDEHLLPLRPGELVVVIGRTSNYKSGLMQYWARNIAQDIDGDGEIVVYVTWEMAVEELGLYDLAASASINASEIAQGRVSDEAWERLQAAAMQRAAIPLWLIGHSVDRRKRRPDLTLSNVGRALQWIDDEKNMRPRAIFLDYLGQMQAEKGEDRRMQTFENVRRCKDMALALGCPVILGVQAGRQMDGREWKLPEIGDGQESSNIEQTADKVISVWLPKTSEPIGSILRLPGGKGPEITVTDNLLVIGLKKQRLGPANKVVFCYADVAKNDIKPLAVKL